MRMDLGRGAHKDGLVRSGRKDNDVVSEMQIETTVRHHLTLVRIAIIKKSTNNKCWRGCGEKGTLLHC